MSVLNNWYHYAYLHLNGANQQRYNPSVISNYRNSLKERISGINDEGIKGELLEYLGPLLSVKRNDFEGTISEIEKTVNPINSLYRELKNQQSETTNESRIKRIVSESVKKVIKEGFDNMINSKGQLSKPLLKIKAKVEEVAQMVNGNECVDTSSTWQIPYVPNYTIQEYRGNALRVVRTEQENSYYNNGGRKITSASKKQVWIITDKNYKEKWNGDYYDEGLKHYLARDKKGFNAYNR